MDARTGEVLHAKNADTRLHPASLTKMMTLYIAFEAIERGEISLDTMVTVSKNAASEPPSRLGLKAGQKIALRHLIRAAAIKSANDAATAIGEAVGGSEAKFAARMNRTAKAIGMKNSTFKNAHGLTESGHLSTARDMSILGRRLFFDYPQYYNIFSRRTTDAGIAQVSNTNRRFLDAYEGADGIKTGYTQAAGFNLTASAQRGNKRIIATVFGGASTAARNAKMADLLDIGFRSAPNSAPVNEPAPPVYAADPEAEAIGQDVIASADSDSRSVGKTIRLVTAPTKSPRPQHRPTAVDPNAAAEVVVAMQDSIAGALAAAVEPETAAAEPGQPVAVTEVAGLSAAITPEPRPEALLEPATEAPAEAAVEVVPTELAEVPATAETPAPESPFAMASAETEALAAFDQADAANVQLAAMTVVSPRPEPKPEKLRQIIHTAAPMGPVLAEAPTPEPTAIVTRISTSGGRHWGVNVGRFTSRGQAERALMQTALAESATLNNGLQKVVQKGGKFDANYMGLTQEQADLACRRLQARGTQCFTIGP
ncbi:D-alanyl-D-alanine carboxypeptidase [Aliigemmobacter aestuarii]|uniref:D-alanyl-D-alanine carboxypeptidase n=2 Tax=Aliigemmobacter aestuarii TaxID=1445661 RepID=A0A4S3MN42_9RHOB|nr:D-alanyl-D-alanine carboxypeptidase [Gemmobacter aestuarii]